MIGKYKCCTDRDMQKTSKSQEPCTLAPVCLLTSCADMTAPNMCRASTCKRTTSELCREHSQSLVWKHSVQRGKQREGGRREGREGREGKKMATHSNQ